VLKRDPPSACPRLLKPRDSARKEYLRLTQSHTHERQSRQLEDGHRKADIDRGIARIAGFTNRKAKRERQNCAHREPFTIYELRVQTIGSIARYQRINTTKALTTRILR
jgi:hypothetical protein